jgi:hypothetical protein
MYHIAHLNHIGFPYRCRFDLFLPANLPDVHELDSAQCQKAFPYIQEFLTQ